MWLNVTDVQEPNWTYPSPILHSHAMETISNTAFKVHYHVPILVNHKNSTKQETLPKFYTVLLSLYSTINTYLNLWPPVHWFFIAFHHPIMVQQFLNCDPAFWISLWKSNQYCLWLKLGYSKISNNGPYQKQITSGKWTDCLHPFDFTIELIHLEPPRSGHLSTDTYQPQTYLSQYKTTFETDSETMPTDVFVHNGDACQPLS